jgi:phosphodiesterase/alkaline phosphatase D-like protein
VLNDGRLWPWRYDATTAWLHRSADTHLGAEQEAWLQEALSTSPVRWNVLAQQSLMAQVDATPGPEQAFWSDGWDGYPAARSRLLSFIADKRPANPLVIGGDVHSYWVGDLKPDSDDPRSPVVATEFCGASITSQGPPRSASTPHAATIRISSLPMVRNGGMCAWISRQSAVKPTCARSTTKKSGPVL